MDHNTALDIGLGIATLSYFSCICYIIFAFSHNPTKEANSTPKEEVQSLLEKGTLYTDTNIRRSDIVINDNYIKTP